MTVEKASPRETSGAAETTPDRYADRLRGSGKRAEIVANDIELEIARRGWPVGEVLGSEAELLSRYSVSRAVLREAIRLLEHHGIANMRRGPGGGLVVTKPDASAVTGAAALYLRYRRVTADDIYAVRVNLELAAVEAAAAGMTANDYERLETNLVASERAVQLQAPEADRLFNDFHRLIAEVAGNPALSLFVDVTSTLTEQLSVAAPVTAEATVVPVHRRILDALAAGDANLASHRMKRHLQAALPWWQGVAGRPRGDQRR